MKAGKRWEHTVLMDGGASLLLSISQISCFSERCSVSNLGSGLFAFGIGLLPCVGTQRDQAIQFSRWKWRLGEQLG